MKKFSLFLFGTLVAMVMNAQLKVTSGATITITGGAVVFCGGDVTNDAGGTITNNGKLEVQGNFANAGTYNTTTSDDSLILSGNTNVTLNGGSSVLTNLWINKSAAGNEVKLAGTTLLGGKLDYDQGNFTTDPITNPSFTFSAPITATFDFAAGKEIVGRVRRTGWNGTSTMFNQPNMLVATNGGTPPTDYTVIMIPQSAGGDPTGAEREVKRKFNFATTGGTGFTSDIRYPYLDGELNTNTEANLVPWQNATSVWNGRLTPVARDGATNYVSTTGLTTAEIANEWKLADPKYTFSGTVYMRGAWNNAGGVMRTNLNSGGVLESNALSHPYSGTPYNYTGTESVSAGFFAANPNIVDWVLLELRRPDNGLPASADASSIVGRKAVFLLNNGQLVDVDGVSSPSFDITKQGNAFMVIRHRNHLSIMSTSLPSNATGSFSNNFSVFANVYKNPSATSEAVTVLFNSLPGSGLYGMWPGDVNRSGSVTTADVSPINIAIVGPSSGNTNVYNVRDVNLDRNVTTADVSNANFSIANFANSSTFRMMNPGYSNLPKVIKSHVPGESTGE